MHPTLLLYSSTLINKGESEGVRVSLATIIAISTLLKVSSDGVDFLHALNDRNICNESNRFSLKCIFIVNVGRRGMVWI